jgi:hypothetical protein
MLILERGVVFYTCVHRTAGRNESGESFVRGALNEAANPAGR